MLVILTYTLSKKLVNSFRFYTHSFDYEPWNQNNRGSTRDEFHRLLDYEPWNHDSQIIEGGACNNGLRF